MSATESENINKEKFVQFTTFNVTLSSQVISYRVRGPSQSDNIIFKPNETPNNASAYLLHELLRQIKTPSTKQSPCKTIYEFSLFQYQRSYTIRGILCVCVSCGALEFVVVANKNSNQRFLNVFKH